MTRKAITLLIALGFCVSSLEASPRKSRTLPKGSAEDSSQSAETTQAATTTAAEQRAQQDLPEGVTLSTGYVTTVRGDLSPEEAALYAPGSTATPQAGGPDIVVQAVPVGSDGQPIAAEPAGLAENEEAVATIEEIEAEEPTEESTGDWLLDFFLGVETPEEPADPNAVDEQGLIENVPFPELSPVTRNPRLGRLVDYDQREKIGVLWLDSRYLAFYGDELLLSRRRDLSVSGVFRMTRVRDSKAVGMELLYGEPQSGEEIIIPGPAYEPYVNELISSGAIVLEMQPAAVN